MEKKNNKKKLFAIIGGSVLAFVLTIALSVSITLAYFGQTTSDSETITLAKELSFTGDAITATVSGFGATTKALPGDELDVKVEGTVSNADGYEYFLRVKAVPAQASSDFSLGTTATIQKDGAAMEGYELVKGDGDYFYLVASDAKSVAASLTDTDVKYTVTIKVTVDPTLTNEDASTTEAKTFVINATMGIIQSANIDNDSLSDLETAWNAATLETITPGA